MKLLWTTQAWADYLHWQASDPKVLGSINDLIKDIGRDPFRGLGKPEPAKPLPQRRGVRGQVEDI